MGEVILKIENGTKKFKNELIFQNVSMEFEKGNSYGFVGPNGCGKSVFFKTLCGYSLLTEGQVIYRGKIIGKEQDFIDDAGIVIEEPEFINSLSGLENLKILAEIQKKISEAEIIEVLTINEQISNFAQTYPTNLKASSNEALLFMRRYRFANCSCFSCCFKDAYPSSNVQ